MTFRLIPTDQKFYELFAAQAEVAAEGARVLEAELRDYVDPVAAADRLRDLEHRGDDVNHAVLAHLEATFVVPFERQDIHALTGVLDDIIDLVEKVGDLLVLYHVPVPPPGAVDQASILVRACDVIVEGVGGARQTDRPARVPAADPCAREGGRCPSAAPDRAALRGAAECARGPDRRGDLRGPRGRDRRRRPGRPRPGPDRDHVRHPSARQRRSARDGPGALMTSLGPRGMMRLAAGSSISRTRPRRGTWNTLRANETESERAGDRRHRAASSAG